MAPFPAGGKRIFISVQNNSRVPPDSTSSRGQENYQCPEQLKSPTSLHFQQGAREFLCVQNNSRVPPTHPPMGAGGSDFPELMADMTKVRTTGAVTPLPHTPALRVQDQIHPVSNKCTPLTTAEEMLAQNTQTGNVTVCKGNVMG